MIDLPNDKWLRSPKKPDYAICFDPANRHFLWVFRENPDGVNWTSVYALTAEDLVVLLGKKDTSLDPFRPFLQKRLDEFHAHLKVDQERNAHG